MSGRMAAWLWYRGDGFAGFQQQPAGGTVQQAVEAVFDAAGADSVRVMPAGRTDRGVSARMQVLSFRLGRQVDPVALRARVDEELARLVGALGFAGPWVEPVKSFHAQWSATSREYRYRIALNAAPVRPEWARYVWAPETDPRIGAARVDPVRLAEVLRQAEGTRDFSAFHEKGSVQKLRRLERARMTELGNGVFEIALRGDSFGRHQVRYLVGSALLVAAGQLSAEQFTRALEEAEPIRGLRAPPEPLVLWEVAYPPEVDPFSAAQRRSADGVPAVAPFHY